MLQKIFNEKKSVDNNTVNNIETPQRIENTQNSTEVNNQNDKINLVNYVYVVIEIDQPDISSEIVDVNKNERERVGNENKAWAEAERMTDRSNLIEGDRVLRPANLPPLPEYKRLYTELKQA